MTPPTTDVREDLAALRRSLHEIADFVSAAALASWDQETGMPAKGLEGRGALNATLAGIVHARWVDPRLAERIARLEAASGALDAEDAALVRETARDQRIASRIEESLVRELAEARTHAHAAWVAARSAADFALFEPHFTRLLELKRREADMLGHSGAPLDALLDLHERGMTVASLERLFADLRAELKPLVAAVLAAKPVDVGPLKGEFPEDAQLAFARDVAKAMGFDFEAGRIDRAPHPFCTGIHAGDVRLTWRSQRDDLRPALYGVIHEAGHGLYEQGLPRRHARTPLGEATSLGVHESQSRLWENTIARSRGFWVAFLPRLAKRFPGRFDGVGADALYRAANEVRPSLIRVEADELTYNLHVVLRFEIERDLFAGRLAPKDVPARWDDGMADLLGVRPADAAEGALQDIHWSMGAFGYFPTYTLGNLYAAQLHAAARRAIGGLDDAIERGDLAPLREWLRENVHAHGRLLEPRALIERATGAPPGMRDFMDYAWTKFGDIHGLGSPAAAERKR